MKKKMILATLCSVSLLAASLAGCGSTDSSSDSAASDTTAADSTAASTESASTSSTDPDDYPTLLLAERISGTTPSDVDSVSEAISEITREKIGCNVELMIISSGSYVQQMTLMLSGDEKLDIMGANSSLYNQALASGALQPLDDLLAEYGSGITEALGDEWIQFGQVGGVQYSIPVICDSAIGYGAFMMRTDILEKYDINPDDIKTMDDVTAVFETVHENEPDMIVFDTGSVGYSPMQFMVQWDKLGDYFGVLENLGQTTTVTNLFESDQYREYLDLMRDWYQKGYMSADITSETEAGASRMKGGNLFCYANASKPGIETQESVASGQDLTCVQVLETLSVTSNNWQWTIPQNCEDPELAMQFLNLLYTDADIANLMAYGIEGRDYVEADDGSGRITFPEGKDASTVGYNFSSNIWAVGNEFLTKVWITNDADIWEQTKEWNTTGVKSEAYGFFFDNSSVSTEEAAVQSVYDEYRMSLECGVVDPDDVLDEMNSRLYDAGLQTIIDEKQSQLDEWLASKSE